MRRRGSLGSLFAAMPIIVIVILVSLPIAAAQSKFKTLHRFVFGYPKGVDPTAGLIFDHAGNLYGTTEYGGICGCGSVFQLTPNPDGSWSKNWLHFFGGGTDGSSPRGSLIFDQAGNLYGTTSGYATSGSGTVFKLKPKPDGSWTESVLYSFTGGSDGAEPAASLIFDQSGNFYSTTISGGANNSGTVFKLTPKGDGSWAESVLYAFTGGKDGAGPLSSLIFDRDGNLYGTTWYGANPACSQGGCGAVFKLMPSADGSWKAKGLHDFTNAKDGAHPVAGLIFDRAGNLYGTTLRGGDLNYGVVFKLARNSKGGWNETVLHTFTDQVGASPFATLIFDASGNLYGTTYGDNLNIFGSVFEITP